MAIGTLMCIDSPNDSREYDLFGIGGFEFVIIIVFALFIFGPDKLPEIGKNVGKALKMFNKAKNEFETVVKTDILKPEDMKAVRDMQDDLQSITSAVKNPMSLLTTKSSETAEKVKQDMEQTVGKTNADDLSSRPRCAAECSDEPSASSPAATPSAAHDEAEQVAHDEIDKVSDENAVQTPQQACAEVCSEVDETSDENAVQTPQQACANTPQRSEDVSASTVTASASSSSSVAQDIWAATTDTIAEEN